MRVRVLALLALAAAPAAALAGCGVGPGPSPGGVRLLVTRDFGRHPLKGGDRAVAPRGADTVLRLLERNHRVTTRYGGGFVQAIDGVSGGQPGGRPHDWFFYVNGSEGAKGSAGVRVNGSDVVWWDFHDWGAAMDVPAVVGAFPEPFRHGLQGKRLPVILECTANESQACSTAADRLAAVGVIASQATYPSPVSSDSLRILVGPWTDLRGDFAARPLEKGPQASGVFARPAADGRTVALLDQRGRMVRTLGPGTGLVAAARLHDQDPTWLVTGTDDAGVRRAAQALTEQALRGRFAVAVGAGATVPLPVLTGSP